MGGLDVDRKRFEVQGDVRLFSKGRFEVVQIGGLTIGRATYEPGWRWSEDIGPGIGSTRCPLEHTGFVVSGAAVVAFDDGGIVRLSAGDLFHIPAIPHDSWVLGDERYVSLHFVGAERYAEAERPVGSRIRAGDAHCFVCGWANASSLGVSFQPDESGASLTQYIARPEHEGWPGLLHGGVLFALLDDAAGWAARFSDQPCVTSRASIRYRQPVGTHTGLDIVGRVRPRGRVLTATATAGRTDTGSVVAEFEALLFPRAVVNRRAKTIRHVPATGDLR
jgi:acyl-coenzyme A thioesterase PaaI-like protein